MKNLLTIGLFALLVSNGWAADNCAEKEHEAMKVLVVETAQALPEIMITSDYFSNKTTVTTLEGAQILSVAGNIPTPSGDVLVLATFECFGGNYALKGLVIK